MKTYTMLDIERALVAAGDKFLNDPSQLFIYSGIERTVYQGPGGIYFVTSEQFYNATDHSKQRHYTIWSFDHTTGSLLSRDAKAEEWARERREMAAREKGQTP